MESLELKKVKRKLERQESIIKIEKNVEKHSKYNFGKNEKGCVLTSSYSPKAHSFNGLDRQLREQRDRNNSLMVEEFNKGVIYNKKPRKLSKTARRYNQRIKNRIENNQVKQTIEMVTQLLSLHSIKTSIV